MTAALNIASGAVRNHSRKEQRVKPWERAAEARDQAPVQRKVQVTGIMHFTRQAVPAGNQDCAAAGGLDNVWVVQCLPGQLRECLAEDGCATLHLAVAVLLTVCGVPHPVDKQICNVQKGQEVAIPAVCVRVVVGKVDGAVAVTQRHTSQIPEDQHKAPFLVVHIPAFVLDLKEKFKVLQHLPG